MMLAILIDNEVFSVIKITQLPITQQSSHTVYRVISLFRQLTVGVRLGFRKTVESTKKKSKHDKRYDTPKDIGVKWQMDVKFVPRVCYSGKDEKRFYQYTIIWY